MSVLSPLFFGLLAAIGALIVELFVFSFFIQDPSTQSLITTNTNFVFATGGLGFLLCVAFIEETFKYLFLKQTIDGEIGLRNIITFIVFFSLGFSGLEILLLAFNTPVFNSITFTHSIGIFLIHFTTISLFGYILQHPSFKKFALLTIPVAILIHFLYNVAILYQDTLHI